MKETMAMRAPLLERLEELLDRGGTKKDVALLAVSAVALGFSFFAPETLPFNPAWIAIVLCGAPIILGAVIGLVTEFDIKADVLVSLALIAAVAIGEDFAAGEVALIMQLGALLEDLTALSFSRCVDYNPSDEAVTICGLDQPEAAVRLNYLTDSGTEAELVLSVGDRLPDRSGRYAQLEDDTTIYLLETALLDPLMRVAASGLEG